MNKFVVVSFGLMAWVFWELSGGSDFEPKSKRVAQTPAVTEQAPVKTADFSPAVAQAVPTVKRTEAKATPAKASAETKPVIAASAPPAAVESPAIVSVASLATGISSFATPGAPLFSFDKPEAQDAVVSITAPEAARDMRQVSATRVNMREGPGTSFSVVTVLDRGHAVQVLDQNNGGWLKLRDTETGQIGWMSARMVSASN